MKKTLVTIENFGNMVRVTLVNGQTTLDNVRFVNLAWTSECHFREGEAIESFLTTSEKLAKAIQAFRVLNTDARRGKRLWKASPFEFTYINQMRNKGNGYEIYNQGTYQDCFEESETKRLLAIGNSKQDKEIEQVLKVA